MCLFTINNEQGNSKAAQRNDINFLGPSAGNDAKSIRFLVGRGPLPGDLDTARSFGKRIVETTWQFKR